MSRLHIQYREDAFDPRILELTKRFLDVHPWRGGKSRYRKFDTWLHGACMVYGLPDVALVVEPHASGVGRYLKPGEGRNTTAHGVIYLTKFSVVSLFHNFRHHMQANSDQGAYNTEEQEATDAQSWACSLYYVLEPKRFRKAVRRGRIAGVTPPDLLKSNRTLGGQHAR